MQATDPVAIRRATPADNRLLADLGRRTFADSFAADNRPEDMRAYLAAAFHPRRQAAELTDPASLFLIAEIGGDAAGYARLLAETPPACIRAVRPLHLQRIYAVQRWIGRGVGPALMRACIAEAVTARVDGLWLGVWEKNPRALHFYRKWGFSAVGSQPFQLGEDRQTDRVLWRPVDAPTVSAADTTAGKGVPPR